MRNVKTRIRRGGFAVQRAMAQDIGALADRVVFQRLAGLNGEWLRRSVHR